jgi:outer membrane protein TolC
MKISLFLLCLGLAELAWSQDTLTLFQCHTLAMENAPRLKDRDVIRESGGLKAEIAGTSWFPALDFNGKASYQSDVVTITLADPGIPVSFPEVPKDQFGLNLDLTQTLYDGGITRQKKEYEHAATAAALQQVEVDLYTLKNRVNQYYFSILMLQEQRKNLEIHLENLTRRRKVMEAAAAEGTLLEEELKVIDVELLKIRKSINEVDTRKLSLTAVLDLLCGGGIGAETSPGPIDGG